MDGRAGWRVFRLNKANPRYFRSICHPEERIFFNSTCLSLSPWEGRISKEPYLPCKMKSIEFHPPTSSQAGEIIAANIFLRSTVLIVGLDIASRNRRFGDLFVDIDAVGADGTVLRRVGCVLPCCRADIRETNDQLHFKSFVKRNWFVPQRS